MKVAVLLSGGPDSTVLAHDLVHRGDAVVGIHLELGDAESAAALRCATDAARGLGLRLVRVDVVRLVAPIGVGGAVARATHPAFGVALTAAATTAASLGADVLACGVHHGATVFQGNQRHAFDALAAAVSIEAGRRLLITTPYLGMSKSEVLQRGVRLGVDVCAAWSCTARSDLHCGRCLGCGTRRAAVREAGLEDTTRYADDGALEAV